MPDTNPTESDMQAIADQLHALAVKCEKLEQQLVNMTAQRDDAVAAMQNASTQHDRDHEEWRAEFDRHLQRANEAIHDRTRAENRFNLLARFSRQLIVDFLEACSPFDPSALTPEWRQQVRDARDLLALIDRECT